MKMKPILLSIALFFCFVASAQQGKNFSMFSLNNMQHNPAAVGTNDNDIKVFANFRYQYFTVSDKPFQTISASGEIKLFNSTSTRKKGYFGRSEERRVGKECRSRWELYEEEQK